MGGSSSINNMNYVRGSRFDYDQWAKEGCDGWSYRDVLPYFIKSEDNQIPHLQSSGDCLCYYAENSKTVPNQIHRDDELFFIIFLSVICRDVAYHGKGGLLTVSDGTATPLNDVYRRAMEELGFPVVDCNGKTQTGLMNFMKVKHFKPCILQKTDLIIMVFLK